MKNYIDLGKRFPGTWEQYVYLDTEDLLAESLFRRNRVHVRIDGLMSRENEEYMLVAVKVLRKDEAAFFTAMEDLKGKMLLFGHRDYETHGGELMDITRDIIRREADATGRVELPTGGTVRAAAIPGC